MATRMAQRVLIVEDEQHLAEGLRFNLDAEGFDAEVLDNGDRALARLLDPAEHFDLVVLDVMLPGKDGFAVVRELRQRKHFVPVLMLTARGRPEDVLNGFAAGADDYLAKPAELAILLARIGGLLRRSAWSRRSQEAPPEKQHDRFTFSGKTIDFDTLALTTLPGWGPRRIFCVPPAGSALVEPGLLGLFPCVMVKTAGLLTTPKGLKLNELNLASSATSNPFV